MAKHESRFIMWRVLLTGWKILAAVIVISIGVSSSALGAEQDFATTPAVKQGRAWRIAYYEGGQQSSYYHYLASSIKGLMSLGWIERRRIPSFKGNDTRALWNWLVEHGSGPYITFVSDGYYAAGWDKQAHYALSKKVIRQLNTRDDIDLVIAMGTWAGRALATHEHDTPTIVMSSNDPIGAGIIKSIDDSGMEHIYARVDPYRTERQVRMFHNLLGFKKLGVAYESGISGRSHAALELIDKVAKVGGFEVVPCYTKDDIADLKQAGEAVIDCFHRLARQADAIYVTNQRGVNDQTLPKLVKISHDYRIPTFSQYGEEQVRKGILLSLSRQGFDEVGLFLARTMARVMNGAKPRQLEQLFEEKANVVINLKTAEKIGLYVYADLLAVADKIYRDIEMVE